MTNQSQGLNIQKMKCPVPGQQVNTQPNAQQQRNTASRMPGVNKAPNAQMMNQVMNMQPRVTQVSHAMTLKVPPQQVPRAGHVFNNQKMLQTNHKNQLPSQGLNKAQPKVTAQHKQPGVINNAQKQVVCAAQKTQVPSQIPQHQMQKKVLQVSFFLVL